jgi:hypothetical protein
LNDPESKTSVVSGVPENLKTERVNDPQSQKTNEQPSVVITEKREIENIPEDISGKHSISESDVPNLADKSSGKLNEPDQNKINEGTVSVDDPESKTSVVSGIPGNLKTERVNVPRSQKTHEQPYAVTTEKRETDNIPEDISRKRNVSEGDVPNLAEEKSPGKVKESGENKIVRGTASLNDSESKTSADPGILGTLKTERANDPQPQKADEEQADEKETKKDDLQSGNSITHDEDVVTGQNLSSDPAITDKTESKDTLAVQAVPEKEIAASQTQEALEEDEETSERVTSRWSVFLSLAPDFSSTGFGHMTAPGGAAGIQISYRIFPKISVHTGLIRSSKKYESEGSYYQPPEGYWQNRTNGRIPDQVSGRCSILEIPLWIRYDVSQRDRSGFYVSGGVSSYVMMSESYDYTFETDNPGAAKGWSSSKSSSYPFAIGHLSAGYEKNITPALGIGFEPFVKIPFSGIGWSNVDLFTTGFYVNVRYRFLKRMKSI